MTEADARRGFRAEVFPAASDLADAAAGEIAVALEGALTARGRASLVVTGGTTPAPIYDRLARIQLDWSRVEITLSDERWVEPDAPESNEWLIRSHLIRHHGAHARFLPLKNAAPTPEIGMHAAETLLATMSWPVDLVLLGIGSDAHIASLFPGHPALEQGLDRSNRRRCVAVAARSPAPLQPRLSLTLSALLDSRRILIAGIGADKRHALELACSVEDPRLAPAAALLRDSDRPVRSLWAPAG